MGKRKYYLTNEQKQNIIQDYKNGMLQKDLMEKYQISSWFVKDLLSKSHIEKRQGKFFNKQRKQIADEWQQGATSTALAQKYNVNNVTILDIVNTQGVKTFRRPKTKYKINDKFFKEITTENQAYWLGFLAADGNINNNAFRLYISNVDKEHLIRFQKDLQSNHPIRNEINNIVSLTIGRKTIVKDLEKLYICKNKTGNEKFPYMINEPLYRHYIRGYFDGDGCLYLGKEYKKTHLSFTCANLEFLEDIQSLLVKNANVNKIKIQNYQTYYMLSYCGNGNCNKIYHYLWDSSSIYLPRKIEKFVNSDRIV